MRQLLHTLLGRLSVGRKLLLIFLLDMTAVAFVSGIMINEKYLAIDFARKEQAGHAYISALRDGLLALTDAAIEPPAAGAWPHHAGAVEGAERAHGRDMGSAEPARDYAQALRVLGEPAQGLGAGAPAAVLQQALERGRALVTRVGNQSNLILDPDLDSYYTMSIVVLRVPELLEVSAALSAETLQGLRRGAPDDVARTRFLILEGRLDAVTQGLASDYAEAYAAAKQPGLRPAMEPSERKLLQAIAVLRTAARSAAAGETQAGAASLAAFAAMHRGLTGAAGAAWRAAGDQLDVLLQARIDGFFARMWLHLGTALALLGLILSAVYFVATQIANPLKHLASVMDAVAVSGDHALRARWNSRDEIGRLVRGFNGMLAQLDRGRVLQQELAASARAAEAQRELVEALPIPMMVTSVPSHQVLHANLPAQRWLGSHRDNPWQHALEPAVRVRFFQQLFDRDAVDEFEVRWQAGGETSWAVLSARRLTYEGQDAVLTAFTPINHLKHMERRLELWAKVFQASSEGILIIDADRHVLTANRAFCQATLYDLYDVVGDPPLFFDTGAGSQAFLDGLWPEVSQRGSWQGEVRMRRRDGREYPAWLMISVVREKPAQAVRGVQPAPQAPAVSHYIAITIDISDRKRHEDRIRFLARHDVLTELPNRSLCNERLGEALDAARADGSRVAVLFIDLDRFKTINDTLGHHVGDGLLRSVAKRLQEAVRGSDTVCRLGGDEFVIILRGVVDAQEVAQVVSERLVPSIRAPHDVEGAELHVSCSVGVALYPDDARDIDTLMRHADAAMYQAKASGRDAARFFTSELNERAQHRLRIETLLRHAVERGELALAVQPRVDARTHAVVGVEALLRWTSAELGEVTPAAFIPVAEECGLIMPIGRWVIDTACALQASWRAEGAELGALPIAINVSALQLRDGSLPRHLAEAMAAHGVPPGALEVELTESTLMDGAEAILMQLREIRALGVLLAIDDFGTGYSSLQYLNRFPIDRLKVDRSFVQDMLDDSTDHAIARGIISLGHTLGLRVVAEGVEHERIARALLACGCDELQGFHYGRPMAPDVFVAWLARRESTANAAPKADALAV